ncbi:unnamed protein product [Caenorhabditis brenneri]
MSSTNWDSNGEDALRKFILIKLSNCVEIQNVTDIGHEFIAAHPSYKSSGGGWAKRIRNVLDQINADDYNGNTLARMMFCLSHPLRKLKKVKKKIESSGDLRVNSSSTIITYYKDEHVKLSGTRQDQNKLRIQKRQYEERKKQVEAGMQMRLEIEYLKEVQEMEKREKIKEDERMKEHLKKMKKEEAENFQKEIIQNQIAIKFEYGGLGDQDDNVNAPVLQIPEVVEIVAPKTITLKTEVLEVEPEIIDQEFNQEYEGEPNPTIQSVEEQETRGPTAKRARVEETSQRNDHLMHPVDPVPIPVLFPTPQSTPAPSIIGHQENKLDYRFLLRSILNYSRVMNSKCFEGLQSEILEELNEPDVVSKQISEQKVSEAIREGIKATTTRLKAETLNPSVSISLPEFFRFWQLKLFEMEFEEENELVKEISSHIQNPMFQVGVKLYNVRLGLEMTLTKLRQ